ncbi:MAG: hypothetical protein J2P48_16155 [Alphaproteobacteria bacterium]|nr:hypothetical protein [Alphaproteobacteria bacterium]
MTFRVRRLSDNLSDPARVGGDMTAGRGTRDYLVDSPTAVAQAVLTRLLLWQGEWWLNLEAGTPWLQQVLGQTPARAVPQAVIRDRILQTPYVTRIDDFTTSFDRTTRALTVSAKVETAFGPVTEAPAGAVMSPSGAVVMPLIRQYAENLRYDWQRQIPR